MTKQDAQAFIELLRTMRPFNLPLYFDPLVANPICRTIEQVAAGNLEVTANPPRQDEQPPAA